MKNADNEIKQETQNIHQELAPSQEDKLPEYFYKSLAKSIAKKQLERNLSHAKSEWDEDFILNCSKEIYENTPDYLKLKYSEEIKRALETKGLVREIIEFVSSLNREMKSLRRDIHSKIFKRNPKNKWTKEELYDAYYHCENGDFAKIYLPIVDKGLEPYIDLIEDAIKNNKPTNSIRIYEGLDYNVNFPDTITYDLQMMIGMIRKEKWAIYEVYTLQNLALQATGKKYTLTPYEESIIKELASHLIIEYIAQIRERGKGIETPWDEMTIEEFMAAKKEKEDKFDAEFEDALKRDREGLLYYLTEPLKDAGHNIKNMFGWGRRKEETTVQKYAKTDEQKTKKKSASANILVPLTVAIGFGDRLKNILAGKIWQYSSFLTKPIVNIIEFGAGKLPISQITQNAAKRIASSTAPLVGMIAIAKAGHRFYQDYQEDGIARATLGAAGEISEAAIETGAGVLGATAATALVTTIGTTATIATVGLPMAGGFAAAYIAKKTINTVCDRMR